MRATDRRLLVQPALVAFIGRVEVWSAAKQHFQLAWIETNYVQIETICGNISQFLDQHILVPSGIKRQFVVAYYQSAALSFRKSSNNDTWNVGHLQFFGRHNAAMTGDDSVMLIDQDGICKSELSDGAGKLGNLGVGVQAGVSGVWDEVGDISPDKLILLFVTRHRFRLCLYP